MIYWDFKQFIRCWPPVVVSLYGKNGNFWFLKSDAVKFKPNSLNIQDYAEIEDEEGADYADLGDDAVERHAAPYAASNKVALDRQRSRSVTNSLHPDVLPVRRHSSPNRYKRKKRKKAYLMAQKNWIISRSRRHAEGSRFHSINFESIRHPAKEFKATK